MFPKHYTNPVWYTAEKELLHAATPRYKCHKRWFYTPPQRRGAAVAWRARSDGSPGCLITHFPRFDLLNAYARAGFVPRRVFVYHVRSFENIYLRH